MNEHLTAAILLQRGAYRISLGGPSHRPCALTRANAPVFYSLGAASLLEATAPAHVERTLAAGTPADSFSTWLQEVWSPQHAGRVRLLRHYLAVNWPEFDWASARERFESKHVFLAAADAQATPSQRALAACAAVSQSALFYRSLSRWADDTKLRELARVMAAQDAAAFDAFRRRYEAAPRRERPGMRVSWRTIASSVRKARDVYVQDAFDALVAQWGPNAPFTSPPYAEFTQRVAAAVAMHVPLGWCQRAIFRAWMDTPRALVPKAAAPAPRNFRPVLEIEERGVRSAYQIACRWRP